ncbi:MAG: FKBP-type peptidyl-prolyl cis-trans isomerase [Chloroflexi bacterium]|nr:MAG: FKBP-type peptidyl-prolyl cis-trans isomerase [Chloroflexota bacterium]
MIVAKEATPTPSATLPTGSTAGTATAAATAASASAATGTASAAASPTSSATSVVSTTTGAAGAPGSRGTESNGQAPGIPTLSGEIKTTSSGLRYIDETVGTGATAQAGKVVAVHYTGWLTTGAKFDSSRDRGQPFAFPLGAGRVITGWDQGVAGMNVGGKRRLIIPAALGYGAQALPGIPANSTLIFDVELLAIQ